MRNMGRSGDVEAFARLLDGAPAGELPTSVAALGRTASALRAIPAPVLPAALTAAGGVAIMARAGTSTPSVVSAAAVAKPAATIAKVAAAKAGLLSIFASHLAPVMAGTALLAVGVTGVAVGASRSLPGDPLYGLKRATESVHTATITGRVSLAERRLDLATNRLHEAQGLQERGGSAAQLGGELREWTRDESAALAVLRPLASTPDIRAKLAAFSVVNATGLAAFPAAVVAPQTAAVSAVTALLRPGQLPTTPEHPAAVPGLPTTVASLAPHNGTSVTPARPSTEPPVPARHATTPVAPAATHPAAVPGKVAPTVAASSVPAATDPGAALPSALPTSALPTSALPTIGLPAVGLPTSVPSLPAVTTLLQSLLPRH